MNPIRQSLILIVDDNQTNVKVLFDVLQSAGHRVLVANSGESALKKLQSVSPDLILLDVMMPGINGFETCERLKSKSTTQDIAVIFMTALSDAEDKVKGLALGAVDYITKPFQQEEVLARVNVHLKLKHLNRELEQLVAERTAELTTALAKLQQSQLQLVQTEKMSALGQLIAGVAHEINNPLGFIKGNLIHAIAGVQDLITHMQLYQQQAPAAKITLHAKQIDLEFTTVDLPNLLTSMKNGTERITEITDSLRIFSRCDRADHSQGESRADKVSFDLHQGIDSTLLILQYRLKATGDRPAIQVIKNYGNLTPINCFPGQLNQVFMNLFANAIDAIEEALLETDKVQISIPQIQVKTAINDDKNQVIIRIKDNGIGMNEEVRQKIFDYSFTTKPIGKGTGLGLAIAYQIIVQKHGGNIKVDSIPGQGTEFIIYLPA